MNAVYTYKILLATYNLQPTTSYLQPTTYQRTDYHISITYYTTTYYLLPIHYLRPTIYYPLPSAQRWLHRGRIWSSFSRHTFSHSLIQHSLIHCTQKVHCVFVESKIEDPDETEDIAHGSGPAVDSRHHSHFKDLGRGAEHGGCLLLHTRRSP